MPVPDEPRSFWTWGYVSDEPSEDERAKMARHISKLFGEEVTPPEIPRIEDIELRKSRIQVPSRLRPWVSSSAVERITHTYGGHSLELLDAARGKFDHPPDAVAHPRNEDELEATLEWCDREAMTVIPYGGGTTVVWGLGVPESAQAAVVIDLDELSQVLEVDPVSRAARIQAGMLGPHIENHLRPLGLTLRHFPQSFPWSTLGGWVATRSGGHYATNHTHIDEFVESVRMLTPSGWWESRRLPGSGAGPSPDRLVCGSEGTLGIISEAWMRVQERPSFRATAGVVFPSWEAGAEATRHIVQAKLWPANLRLLDPAESAQSASLSGQESLLIVGFESSVTSQRALIAQAVEIARACGGKIEDASIRIDDGTGGATGRGGAVGAWRDSFIGVNAGLTNGLGLLADTFETAITWDKWPEFDAQVREAVGAVLKRTMGDSARLSCRFTHVYVDGPAPYYSFRGKVPIGGEFEVWSAIKQEALDVVLRAGGTVTHHHAVGRMHRDGWQKQRPALFETVLRASKNALDPRGILNPGVLFPE